MEQAIDVVELAGTLAEIASTTGEQDTAAKILDVVDRLLTKAGLPPAPKIRLFD